MAKWVVLHGIETLHWIILWVIATNSMFYMLQNYFSRIVENTMLELHRNVTDERTMKINQINESNAKTLRGESLLFTQIRVHSYSSPHHLSHLLFYSDCQEKEFIFQKSQHHSSESLIFWANVWEFSPYISATI